MIVNIQNQIHHQGVVFKGVLQCLSESESATKSQQSPCSTAITSTQIRFRSLLAHTQHTGIYFTGTPPSKFWVSPVFTLYFRPWWSWFPPPHYHGCTCYPSRALRLLGTKCLKCLWRVALRITRKSHVTKLLKEADKKIWGYLDPDDTRRHLQSINVMFAKTKFRFAELASEIIILIVLPFFLPHSHGIGT